MQLKIHSANKHFPIWVISLKLELRYISELCYKGAIFKLQENDHEFLSKIEFLEPQHGRCISKSVLQRDVLYLGTE